MKRDHQVCIQLWQMKEALKQIHNSIENHASTFACDINGDSDNPNPAYWDISTGYDPAFHTDLKSVQ